MKEDAKKEDMEKERRVKRRIIVNGVYTDQALRHLGEQAGEMGENLTFDYVLWFRGKDVAGVGGSDITPKKLRGKLETIKRDPTDGRWVVQHQYLLQPFKDGCEVLPAFEMTSVDYLAGGCYMRDFLAKRGWHKYVQTLVGEEMHPHAVSDFEGDEDELNKRKINGIIKSMPERQKRVPVFTEKHICQMMEKTQKTEDLMMKLATDRYPDNPYDCPDDEDINRIANQLEDFYAKMFEEVISDQVFEYVKGVVDAEEKEEAERVKEDL